MIEPTVLLLDENRGFGGAERHALTLATELHSRGHLEALVGRPDSWLRQACPAEIPFFSCGFRNEVDMCSVFSLYKLLKKTRAKVLHCIAHRDLVTTALARQLPGAPPSVLIKAEHSFPDSDLSPLFRWAYRQCDGLACVSEALRVRLREALDEDAAFAERMVVIPNGIAMKEISSTATEAAENRKVRIGVLSALNPGKGQADFLAALAQFSSEERSRFQITLAGAGPLREELESQAQRLRIDAEFLGHCDVPYAYLQDLDLCVLPSHTETFSLVALEALSLGVPLLAADSEGVEEIYQEADMLYPKGNSSELHSRMAQVLKNLITVRQRAARLAQRYRRDFSRETMGENYSILYRDLLHRKAAPH